MAATKFPESITIDQLLESISPLLEVLGTDQNSVFAGKYAEIKYSHEDDDGDFPSIKFISAVDPEDGTEPITVGEGEFAEQGWPVVVSVVG